MKESQKQKDLRKKDANYIRFQNSAEGMETAQWTYIDDCLHGRADNYEGLEENYFSYGPDGFRAVGPTFGPLHITDLEQAKKACSQLI